MPKSSPPRKLTRRRPTSPGYQRHKHRPSGSKMRKMFWLRETWETWCAIADQNLRKYYVDVEDHMNAGEIDALLREHLKSK